jgi:hypothetical protein
VRGLLRIDPSIQAAFTHTYESFAWGNVGGGSGAGSTVQFTVSLRAVLAKFIKENKVTSMYDAPCGAMEWTKVFLRDIRLAVPGFKYRGVDVVAHVVAANQNTFANDPLTEIDVGDMTSDPVPGGFDMVFSRDALQHLTFKQIHGALRRFAESDARFVMIGTYPSSSNTALGQPGFNHFDINLEAPPFNLKPDKVLLENQRTHQARDHPKHLAVFNKGSLLKNTNWEAMEMRIFGAVVSPPSTAAGAWRTVNGGSVVAPRRGLSVRAARASSPMRGVFDSTLST